MSAPITSHACPVCRANLVHGPDQPPPGEGDVAVCALCTELLFWSVADARWRRVTNEERSQALATPEIVAALADAQAWAEHRKADRERIMSVVATVLQGRLSIPELERIGDALIGLGFHSAHPD